MAACPAYTYTHTHTLWNTQILAALPLWAGCPAPPLGPITGCFASLGRAAASLAKFANELRNRRPSNLYGDPAGCLPGTHRRGGVGSPPFDPPVYPQHNITGKNAMFVAAPCWRRQLAPSAAFRRQQETCYFQVTIEGSVRGSRFRRQHEAAAARVEVIIESKSLAGNTRSFVPTTTTTTQSCDTVVGVCGYGWGGTYVYSTQFYCPSAA